MPRPRKMFPAISHHKPTGQARIRLDGKDIYCGPWGTPAADEKARKVIAEYLATGRIPATTHAAETPSGLSIAELILAYVDHARTYYVKNGEPTSELQSIRDVLSLLRQHYGMTPAADFGPLRLKALREVMIGKGWKRKPINQRIGRIKRMFKWAVENELVPASVHHGLSAVAGLRTGRSEAAESVPVSPVSTTVVNATLPYLNRQLAAMVKLQAATGMRPGEVCQIRPCDVERDCEVWAYRPTRHKTQHHGRERVVFIGPNGQRALVPFLDDRPADAFCFSPEEAQQERSALLRAARKSRVQPSQQNRRARKPAKRPGVVYSTLSYSKAIASAVAKANRERRKSDPTASEVPVWTPNQLRHAAATAIRREFGLEGAQVALGHAAADVTQVYAERDAALARRVAAAIG